MDAEQQELLERAQLLQQAKKIQLAKSGTSDQPAPGAVGFQNGATPAATETKPKMTAESLMADVNKIATANPLGYSPDAARNGFMNGASMGYVPQISAGAQLAKNWVKSKLGGEDFDKTPSYVQLRDAEVKDQAKMKNENPWSYGLGTVGGTVASSLALPGGAALKAATLPGKIAIGAGTGGLMGLAQNPGDKEGEVNPLQVGERAENGAYGTLFGGAMPIAADRLAVLGKMAQKSGFRSAFKALGPTSRVMEQLGDEGVNKYGKFARENGIVGGVPTSYEGLANRAGKVANKAGEDLETELQRLASQEDTLRASATGTGTPGLVAEGQAPAAPKVQIGIDRKKVAEDLRKSLLDPHNEDVGGVAARNAKFNQLISDFENHAGGDHVGIMQAELKKRAANGQVNWDRLPGADAPVEEEFNKALANRLKQGVEDEAEFLGQNVGGDGGKAFKAAKEQYGPANDLARIAAKKSARVFANRTLSPSDYGTGLAGAAISKGADGLEHIPSGMVGASLAALNFLGRRYGNQILAPMMDNAGQVMMGGGKMLNTSPWLSSALANKMHSQGEQP